MDIFFEPMSNKHRTEIINLLNYYIVHDFSAYPEQEVAYEYYDKFLEISDKYPAFAIKTNNKLIGFCFLNAYNPLPSFSKTATVAYFIDQAYTGKGIGKMALNKLETEARSKGLKSILANIASVNERSIAFHSKNGFNTCGVFKGILRKKNKELDVVWMQKQLD